MCAARPRRAAGEVWGRAAAEARAAVPAGGLRRAAGGVVDGCEGGGRAVVVPLAGSGKGFPSGSLRRTPTLCPQTADKTGPSSQPCSHCSPPPAAAAAAAGRTHACVACELPCHALADASPPPPPQVKVPLPLPLPWAAPWAQALTRAASTPWALAVLGRLAGVGRAVCRRSGRAVFAAPRGCQVDREGVTCVL
ncbi:MAG: hypothetical protein J3K34DRAFT_409268, partial [Monoraphidium minutum]